MMFVGAQRRAVVDDLLDAYDAVAAGEGPQGWFLTAPSGSGKSRVVHEFYARLAAERQPGAEHARYWPQHIAGANEGSSATGCGGG